MHFLYGFSRQLRRRGDFFHIKSKNRVVANRNFHQAAGILELRGRLEAFLEQPAAIFQFRIGQFRVEGIEMQRDAAQRGHDVADPRHAAHPDRHGKRLQRAIEFQINTAARGGPAGLAEFSVHRRVAQRREAQGFEKFFQLGFGSITEIILAA